MNTSIQLNERVALVTGAGTGIGAGVASTLAAYGADIIIAYHSNQLGANVTLGAIKALGRNAIAIPLDLHDLVSINHLFEEIRRKFGRLDILVNNAGITVTKPLFEIVEADWHHTMDVNLKGMFFCSQLAALEMVNQGTDGRIINISSVNGMMAAPNHVLYDISKGGVNMLTKSLAIQLAKHHITVNAIAPGFIEVERSHTNNYDRNVVGQFFPVQRVGFPEDIGHLAAFLASEPASYITGEIILVDGGLMAKLP